MHLSMAMLMEKGNRVKEPTQRSRAMSAIVGMVMIMIMGMTGIVIMELSTVLVVHVRTSIGMLMPLFCRVGI
jgi:hypothetical protein